MKATFLLFALVLLAAFTGCHREENAAPVTTSLPLAQVRVHKLALSSIALKEEVVGTVRPKIRATLEAKHAGRIEVLSLKLGDFVRAGTVLVELELPEVSARLEQAEALHEQAEREWNRVSTLFGQQSSTRAEREAAETRLRAARASVAEAKALLAYGKVLAPFDGVVTRKHAEQGDLATPGKPLIDLEDPGVLQIEIDLPEGLGNPLSVGNECDVIGPNQLRFVGMVTELAPAVDPLTRTRKAKLELKNAPAVLSGQFVRVSVPLGQRKALTMPRSAVLERGQLEVAFVVEQQRARMRLVKTAACCAESVEILSGLAPGETVVTQGIERLRDGQPVEPTP